MCREQTRRAMTARQPAARKPFTFFRSTGPAERARPGATEGGPTDGPVGAGPTPPLCSARPTGSESTTETELHPRAQSGGEERSLPRGQFTLKWLFRQVGAVSPHQPGRAARVSLARQREGTGHGLPAVSH